MTRSQFNTWPIGPSSVQENPRLMLGLLAAAAALLHILITLVTPYDIFRDELYYIACSRHPALGYVDHPPLSIWILGFSRFHFGETLFAIRLLPALASGAVVWMSGLLAVRMGGGRTAVLFTALAVTLAPIFLAMHSIYSMNVFDHLFWVLGAYLIVRLLQKAEPRLWIFLGVVIGLGSLNKIGMLWFAAGTVAAVLLTPLRAELRSRWPWIGAALAVTLFLPFIWWNITHDFAHLEFIRNASAYKYAGLTPLDFLFGQLLLHNPLFLPVWLGGLYWLFFHAEGKKYRALGIVFLLTMVILLVNGSSKAEYLAAAFPMVYAAAGVWIEGSTRERLRWVRPAAFTVLLCAGLLLLPMAAPVLPAETFIRYSSMLGVTHQNSEGKEMAELPQFFADMHGWEDLARTVSSVYLLLPEHERARTVIFGHNYGQAGAIDYYADRFPLPPAVSVHNNYWLWGFPDTVETVIVIGGDGKNHRTSFDEVRRVTVFRSPYRMPYENDLSIWICRGLTRSLHDIWNSEKHYM